MSHTANFATPISSDTLMCQLCPRHCTIKAGQRGFCFVRRNHQGELVLDSYGRTSGIAIDPVEKKPLYHFYPGSNVLSLGTIGCNLGCRFCQNSQISRAHDIDMLPLLLSPEEIAALAVEHQCKSVAFTYNDPIPSFEYYIDIAQCCMKRGINMIAVTAGYIDRIAREPFFSCTQAANIDLKCFSENFYKQLCSAHLQPVLETLEYVANHTSVWLEISVLLIPGKNDSKSELTQMCQWLTHHIGYDVPLTFSAYHPTSTFQEAPSTPADTILRAREIALKAGVKFVYSGNIQHPESSTTFCPHCSAPVIRRHGWHTERCGISHEGICLSCQTPIPGRFAF